MRARERQTRNAPERGLAARIECRHRGAGSHEPGQLRFNAGVALCVTLEVGAQTLGWTGRTVTGLPLLAVVVPYVLLPSLRRGTVRSLRVPEVALG